MKTKSLLVISIILIMGLIISSCQAEPVSEKPVEENSEEVSQPVEEEQPVEEKEIKVALSNSFLGNSWRIEMIKIFEAYAKQLKEKGVIADYYASTSADDAQAQINDVRNMISNGYNVILIDAASPTALAPVLEEAAAQGVVVVSFDNVVYSDNTYSIAVDGAEFAKGQAEWLVNELGGKGNIFLIRGRAGAHDDEVRCAAYFEVLDQYPDIKIIGDGYGGWDFGTTAQLMNDLLEANAGTKLDGILMQGMGEVAVVEALLQHDIDPATVPFTGEWTNGYFRVITEYGLNVYVTGVPPYLSAMALDIALQVLNGEDVERNQLLPPPVIAAEDAEKWYIPTQPDEFVSAYTDEVNTWNLKLEDVVVDN